MRALILAAGAALTLSACGGSESAENADMNAMTADNMMIDQNAMVANDMGMDANAAMNTDAEANMMMNDMTTNDADTNLANGM